MRRLIPSCLVALALSACSNEKAPDVNEAQAAAAVENAARAADGNATRGLPVSDETAALKPGELPPAFEGRWGLRPADCDIARSDTRGLLVIRGSDLTFYAVSGKAKVIGGPSRYNVIADLTFSDKGKTAPRREQYELASAGTTLLRTDPDGKKFRYERC